MVRRRKARESTRIYRVRSNTVVAAVWLLATNGFAISAIFRASGDASILIQAVLYGAASTFFFGRLLWAGVFVSPNGLHIANVFGSFDLKWEDVEGFEMGRWKILPLTCLISLRDGRIKHAVGIEESARFPRGDGVKMVEELNEELRQYSRQEP